MPENSRRIVVADIGGTNSRFALLQGNPLGIVSQMTVPTDVPSFDDVVSELRSRAPLFFETKADCIVVAVAGTVHNQDEIRLTNRLYTIRREQLHSLSDKVLFINDFEAQAWSTMTSLMNGVEPVLGVESGCTLDLEALKKGVLVIGPGTGLGVAYCRLIHKRLLVLPTEAGHVQMPFVSGIEDAYAEFLRREMKREAVEYEDTVCGNGLERIHRFLTGERLCAPEITAKEGFSGSETCFWFSRFLARACRNNSLSMLPRGGVLITGGVAGRCPCIVHNSVFAQEFLSVRPPFDALVNSIPIWLNRNDSSGLWGAAEAAMQYLRAENE